MRAQQGFFAIERTCPTCHGRGETIDNPCERCGGAGRVTRERTLSVNVPAGVEDGTRIRLAGEGEAGLRGGATGDLYIFLAIKPHPFFQRDGADLYCRVPISMVQAALGGEFTVRTLDGGDAQVRIPEGVQSGHQLRLRGKGMPVLRSMEFGDLYIQASRRDAAEPDAPPARAARRIRGRIVEQDPAGEQRLLRQDEGILRGPELTTSGRGGDVRRVASRMRSIQPLGGERVSGACPCSLRISRRDLTSSGQGRAPGRRSPTRRISSRP